MRVLNFGSLNIDLVFAVPHIVAPGETIASTGLRTFAGGKGANQSVALARAGARVAHAGRIGNDGVWLREKLAQDGVDIRAIQVADGPTGQAIIQVDQQGQNSIVLLGGGNRAIDRADIDRTLADYGPGDVLLTQNEINDVAYVLGQAKARGMRVCFNPAPFGPEVRSYPLEDVDLMILNETEAAGLTGTAEMEKTIAELGRRWPKCEVILTLGADGALHLKQGQRTRAVTRKVQAVDTTAAGDTFIGFYLAAQGRGMSVAQSLDMACRAGALCVTRPGAMDSIPRWAEVAASA